jgi:hypothetical protein
MTAHIGDSIFDILSNDATVAGFVGKKIEPLRTTQGEQPPFMIYRINDGDPTDTKDGVSVLDTDRLIIAAFSETYSELKDIGEAVRSALDRYTGTNSGVNIDKIIYENKQDFFNNDAQLYQLELDFRIRTKR